MLVMLVFSAPTSSASIHASHGHLSPRSGIRKCRETHRVWLGLWISLIWLWGLQLDSPESNFEPRLPCAPCWTFRTSEAQNEAHPNTVENEKKYERSEGFWRILKDSEGIKGQKLKSTGQTSGCSKCSHECQTFWIRICPSAQSWWCSSHAITWKTMENRFDQHQTSSRTHQRLSNLGLNMKPLSH